MEIKKLTIVIILLVLCIFCFFAIPDSFGQNVTGTVTLTAIASDITATAGDTECGVASVQFFNGAAPISPVITTPTSGNSYVFTWDTKTIANGTYNLTAKATDKAGVATTDANTCDGSKPNTSTSNTITVVVNNRPPDGTGPSITISINVTVTP